MTYQMLKSGSTSEDRCIKVMKLFLMTVSASMSIFTFLYIKNLSDSLNDADLGNIESIFEDLKECVVKSHICS